MVTDSERIAVLEIKVDHLTDKLEEALTELKEMNLIFQRAKGAQWLLLGMVGVIGFLFAKLPMLVAYLKGL